MAHRRRKSPGARDTSSTPKSETLLSPTPSYSSLGRRLSPTEIAAHDATGQELQVRPSLKKASRSRGMTERLEISWSQQHIPHVDLFVRSDKFDVITGIIILLNCMAMAVYADNLVDKGMSIKGFVDVTEQLFTFFFVVELGLRLIVYGWRSHLPSHSPTNFFDVCLVFVACILPVWILPIFGLESGALQTMTLLRSLRLMRLARVAKQLQAFHEVWILIRGLAQSVRVLCWTVLSIGFITYIFAVFGTVVIGVNLKETAEDDATGTADSVECMELLQMFDGIMPTMMTLIQVLTLDSWSGIARPVMKHLELSWIFFYAYIAVVVFVLLNLVTAVIVDNAMSSSSLDAAFMAVQHEKVRQAELAHIRGIFKDMDEDGNGELSWSEFESAFEDRDIANRLRLMNITSENCQEIFGLLDSGDGVISVEEFFDGISLMEGDAESKELLKYEKHIRVAQKLMCQTRTEMKEDLDEITRAMKAAPKVTGSPTTAPTKGADQGITQDKDAVAMEALLQRMNEVVGLVAESQKELGAASKDLAKGVDNVKGSIPRAPSLVFSRDADGSLTIV